MVSGANGLLGQKLVTALAGQFEVLATARQDALTVQVPGIRYQPLDITRQADCKQLVHGFQPDVIVNAAALTHVDACETRREECWNINVKAVENLAAAARRNMAQLVHLSTDYLFDGKQGPYDEDDTPNPIGYYGKSKLASENAVRLKGVPYAIVRTNVIYGTGEKVKNNFFLWVYNSLRAGKAIRVVTDQYNNPILAEDLAEGIRKMISASRYGIYHLAGREYLNRFDFAVAIADVFDFDKELITPILTADLNQASPRPMKGGLKIDKAISDFQFEPRSLDTALDFLKLQL